jgi:anti-anti-sigma regulatory factor
VIFSLFGKKDGRGSDRRRSAGPETATTRPAPAGGGGSRGTDQREIARRTAAKIDEIESEMIASPRTVAPAQAGLAGTVFVPARGGGVTASTRKEPPQPAAARPGSGPAAPARGGGAPPAPVAPVVPVGRGDLPTAPDTSIILGDASPGGLALHVDAGSSLPPAFEEAAVLYSNGQEDAAASVLWQALQDDSLGAQARQGWSMLFDLYQAIGRKEDFESLAIDFSARFETSPPAWDESVAPSAAPQAPAPSSLPAVTLGATLDAQSVRQMEQLQKLAQKHRAVLLDVSAVRSVDPIGADLLLRVLAAFGRGSRELRVDGVGSLHAIVGTTIEAGRRDASDACWLLQLELLRLLGRQQAFEDMSIDYCVTFEVSPPSWEPLPPSLRPTESKVVAPPPVAPDTGYAAGPEAFTLAGELSGRAQEALAALRAYATDRAEVIIDCRRLRRLDFVAAGELLNEVVSLRTGGKYLVFRDLNHVVAALLAVMGIPDLAEVRLRRQ